MGMTDYPRNKEKLQKICQNKNLPTKCKETKVVKGWMNKQKGAHQILFKCGWVDPTKIHMYTKNGRKHDDKDDNVDPTGHNFSLKAIMQLQKDFLEELMLL